MTYCYKCETCDVTFELTMPVYRMKPQEHCPTCGAICERDWVAEHRGTVHEPGCWPQHSEAAGVHPLQVKEMQEAAAKKGVPTEFTRDGAAVFTSRAHRKKFCQAFRFHDKDAGYGDQAPA